MTPLQNVYDAFFAKMLEDEWANWTEDELVQDLLEILKGAIPWFKFPRVDLTIEGDSFVGDLNNQEIQILATYMKCEWLNRTILTWENVKPLYEERDFSQANLLDKFIKLQENVQAKNRKLQKMYSRSILDKEDGLRKPYDYTKLAGGGD